MARKLQNLRTMRRAMKTSGFVIWLAMTLFCGMAVPQDSAEKLQALLAEGPQLQPAGERLRHFTLVRQFYLERNDSPAWNLRDRVLALQLLAQLQTATEDGLQADYHRAKLQELLAGPIDSQKETALELLLTDAFFSYASDLAFGQINPAQLGLPWQLRREPVDLAQLLRASLSAGTLQVALLSLEPIDPQYARLRQALAGYRRIRDERASLKSLKKGDTGPEVISLQERLMLLGDLVEIRPVPPEIFDDSLHEAVRRFQRRHGLKDDGIAGAATIRELQVTVTERIGQIIANLERIRWMPDQLPGRYIRVNVPAFELQAFEHGEPVLTMRIIAGRKSWSSPVFLDSEIRSVELNPDWDVPQQIVSRELLSTIQKDPDYLNRNDFIVFDQTSGTREVADAATIDWNNTTAGQYHFTQRPGRHNPLGKIKFEFPNDSGCYLHDTSNYEMFEKSDRALSHGCVRVEKPMELAGFLFQGSSEWTQAAVVSAIEQGARSRIPLPEPVPIYFVYTTAWVDSQGVQFRRDLYGEDRRLLTLIGR